AVRALVDAAAWPAADQLTDLPHALEHRDVDRVGLLRIHHDVGRAGPLVVTLEDLLPRGAAVGRLVETAIAAAAPQRSDGRYVDDLGVARIDQDVLDVLRILQPHPLPRLAGVGRLVDAVPERDAALVVVFTRPQPHNVRVPGIDFHGAQGVGRIVVEDRRERGAAVFGLEQAARGAGDIPDVRVLRVDLDVRNASGRDVRSYRSQGQSLEGVVREARRRLRPKRGAGGRDGETYGKSSVHGRVFYTL